MDHVAGRDRGAADDQPAPGVDVRGAAGQLPAAGQLDPDVAAERPARFDVRRPQRRAAPGRPRGVLGAQPGQQRLQQRRAVEVAAGGQPDGRGGGDGELGGVLVDG